MTAPPGPDEAAAIVLLRTLLMPRNDLPTSSTAIPAGTISLICPATAVASIVMRCFCSTASRKSSTTFPKNAVTGRNSGTTQRPSRRSWEKAAVTEFRGKSLIGWPDGSARSVVKLVRSPSVLATSARSDRSACSGMLSRPSAAASLRSLITSSRSASEARRSWGPGRGLTAPTIPDRVATGGKPDHADQTQTVRLMRLRPRTRRRGHSRALSGHNAPWPRSRPGSRLRHHGTRRYRRAGRSTSSRQDRASSRSGLSRRGARRSHVHRGTRPTSTLRGPRREQQTPVVRPAGRNRSAQWPCSGRRRRDRDGRSPTRRADRSAEPSPTRSDRGPAEADRLTAGRESATGRTARQPRIRIGPRLLQRHLWPDRPRPATSLQAGWLPGRDRQPPPRRRLAQWIQPSSYSSVNSPPDSPVVTADPVPRKPRRSPVAEPSTTSQVVRAWPPEKPPSARTTKLP